jgi:hypothetical protein
MPPKVAILLIAILLPAGLTLSKSADGAPSVRLAAQQDLLLRIHGCHHDWEEGPSNVLGGYLVHRHGKNCHPEEYKRRYYDHRNWQRGDRDFDDRNWHRGQRNYDERDYERNYDGDDERNYDEGPRPRYRQQAPY